MAEENSGKPNGNEERTVSIPALSESVMALALLVLAIVCAWMLYGSLIRQMVVIMYHVLRRVMQEKEKINLF